MSSVSPGIPQIPQDYIDKIFDRISGMEIELDSDPLQYGPKRLNNKVAEARGHLTECEGIYLQVSKLLQQFRSLHRSMETEFEISKKNLFANDPEVRSLPHVTDRDALATMKLRKEAQELNSMARNIPDLESLVVIIKAKRADLKDLQNRIRDQIKLCHEEIALGGKWGSKPPPGSKVPDLDTSPSIPRETLNDLRDMFDNSKSPEITDSSVISPILTKESPSLVGPSEEIMGGLAGKGSDSSLDDVLVSIDESGTGTGVETRKSKIPDNLESILDGLGF